MSRFALANSPAEADGGAEGGAGVVGGSCADVGAVRPPGLTGDAEAIAAFSPAIPALVVWAEKSAADVGAVVPWVVTLMPVVFPFRCCSVSGGAFGVAAAAI